MTKDEKKEKNKEKKEQKNKRKQEKKEEKNIKKEEKKIKKAEKKEKRKSKIEEKTIVKEETIIKDKVKKKIKLKPALLIPLILLLLAGIGVGSYLGYNAYQDNTLKTIKKNYSRNVIITKNTNIYNKNKKKIGTITKGVELSLKEVKKLTTKNKLFKIENTEYYVYFKDIKKTKLIIEEETPTNFITLNKNITSETPQDFLLNNKTILTLNELSLPIEYMDEKNYYVKLFDKLFTIKKNKEIKEIENKNVEEELIANHVSVIYYDQINDYCDNDNCLKTISVKAHIKTLKAKGYYFLTKDEYLKYINGYANLKDKAIFFTTSQENDFTNNIKDELGVTIATITEEDKITMVTTNKASTPNDDKANVNRYQAKAYTLIDNYTKIAEGIEMPDYGRENSTNQRIAVLNYHFFYDPETEPCGETICLEVGKFREQLQWLKDNGYKTLTINEYADWIEGIIEVPDKSVLLTVDDGARGTGAHNGNKLIPLLEEFDMHATLFLITGWWDLANYQSPNLDVQSHTNNLHFETRCADGRGLVVCSDYNTVKNDLDESLRILSGNNTAFCYPFYAYDSELIQIVKEEGFRVAFAGGNIKSRRGQNHYTLPRYPIIDDITLEDFIWMVS